MKNGSETGVDCGGSCSNKCANNVGCASNSDCQSNACNAATLLCTSTQCADSHKDGAETDIDCGGGVCGFCAIGKACQANSDCSSNACDALTFVCASSQCNDHKQDGTESDVDCGGTCAIGQRCNTSFDCQVGHTCSPSKICQ